MSRPVSFAIAVLALALSLGSTPVYASVPSLEDRATAAVAEQGKTSGSTRPSKPFQWSELSPVAFGLITLFAGAVGVLVYGTGRETLNAIDVEQTYRELHGFPTVR